MTIDEIKNQYSMRDILVRCGIQTDKHGFCKCCFHKGDNTASMRIYEKDFYCFGCGKGGDLIKFVQLYHNLRFNEACEWISGEALTRKTRTQLAIAAIERKKKERAVKRKRDQLKHVNDSFSGLWQKYLTAKPLSNEWCEAFNKWQTLCYQQEQLLKELEAI